MKLSFNATSPQKKREIAYRFMQVLNTEFACDVTLKGDENCRMPHALAESFVTITNQAKGQS